MVGWVFDRLRDVLREEMGKRPKVDPEDKKKKKWQDYRTGLFHSLDRWDDARAMFTILSGAVTADNDTDPKESRTLDAIVARSRTFRRLNRNDMDKCIRTVAADIADNRLKALEKATRSFAVSVDRKASAYMQALDVLYADQELLGSETLFALHLAEMLTLDDPFLIETYNDLMKAKNWSGPMSSEQRIEDKHKAFFTILAGAVLIDGEEKPDEKQELEALMVRTRTLSHFKDPARTELREDVVGALKRNFATTDTRWDRIDAACRTLVQIESQNQGICYSAFLHAVDLAHADRELVRSEEEYLTRLETKLNLSNVGPTARALMAQKNQY